MAGNQNIITIPRAVMCATNYNWDIDWRGQSVGEPVAGDAQVVFNRQPKWIGSPSLAIHDRDVQNWWRAIRATARGRARIYRVPMVDPVGFDDYYDVERTWHTNGKQFSTDVRFNTGFGFEYRPFVTCVGNTAAGTTEIVVNETSAVRPCNVGQIMSHDDYPFIITSRTPSGTNFRLTVEMPFRQAIPDGAIIFQYATGLFQAVTDTMGLPSYDANRLTRPQLQFTELLTRTL